MPSPTLTGLNAPTFLEDTVNAAGQVIDSVVAITDADNDFNGGTLAVSGLLAEDTVSVASGLLISLSGGAVYYDADGAGAGVAIAIGTVSGGAGSTFTVTFNGSATAAAINALVQSLTYANSSNTPTAGRTLVFNITDAAGHDVGPVAGQPTFVLQVGASTPFGVTIDPGVQSVPSFADLDGDGDKDMAVGHSGGGISYYLNTGSAANPVFALQAGAANPFSSFSVVGGRNSPAFADLDNDGDMDMVTGTFYGLTTFYRNTGTPSAPVFSAAADPFGGGSVGYMAAPAFADMDGNGDLDAFVGEAGGSVIFFRNTGTAIAPAFTVQAGANNPFNGLDLGDNVRPALADIDGDGDIDAVVGVNAGGILYFENTGSTAAATFTQRTGVDNPFNGAVIGTDASPTFVDLDGDGDLDMVAGRADGTLVLYRNTTAHGRAVTVTVTPQADGTAAVDILTGGATGERLEGFDGDDHLDGAAGDDLLEGGAGADYLKGGTGADRMLGGTGNDFYLIDNAGDVADETGGDGIDTVQSRIAWTLGADLENLILGNGGAIGGTGNGLANSITGNSSANTLSGLDGDDTILGGGGADRLLGGSGADALDGGAQNDFLDGGADDDTLTGGAGDDYMRGGEGGDSMSGGAGNDFYVVDDIADTVVELLNEGVDEVQSRISHTLAANVEDLTLGASGRQIDGTGNSLGNVISGNNFANTLSGLDGGDILNGAGGVDTLLGGEGNDALNGGAQNDVLVGGDGNDSLNGGNHHDTLHGGNGSDRLTGGSGIDAFVFSDLDVHLTSLGQTVDKDQILDLSFGEDDRIDLSAIDADIVAAGDQAFTFVSRFSHEAGQAVLTFAGGVSTLQLDVDGDGLADLRIEINGNVTTTQANLYSGPSDHNGGWVL